MKLLSRQKKERLLRLARYRERSRLKRGKRRWVIPDRRYVVPKEVIAAPQKFNLIRGDAGAVVRFLRAVGRRVLVDNKPVKVDFRNTTSFYVAGAILLYSEFDRIVRLSNLSKPITVIDPRARRAREVLKQIDIYSITGDKCDVVPEREDVVFWRATKGKDQSGEGPGSILEYVADRVKKDHAAQIVLSGIWRGVSEAVANTVDHAYLEPRADNFGQLTETKWWMFTQMRDGIFSAAVCDLGCGYKSTVNRSLPEEFLSRIISVFKGESFDAVAIKAAMEYGRSGTHESHRGKGSRDALSVLSGHGTGELHIVSNSGWVQYRFENGVEKGVQTGEFGIDIMGTIIWWKLPIKELRHG